MPFLNSLHLLPRDSVHGLEIKNVKVSLWVQNQHSASLIVVNAEPLHKKQNRSHEQEKDWKVKKQLISPHLIFRTTAYLKVPDKKINESSNDS